MDGTKIQAARWKIYLTLIGVIIFVAMGFMTIFGDTSIIEKSIGVLAIIFFGGFVGKALYSTITKGGGNIIISSKGLDITYPGCPIILIEWKDIEGFGVYKVSGQKFTTIKLYNYNNLIKSIESTTADEYLKTMKSIKWIGNATAVVGILNLENVQLPLKGSGLHFQGRVT